MSRIVKTENNKCDFCEGCGKCTHCSGTGKQKPVTEKQMKRLLGNIVLADRMEHYTDQEVADLLCSEVWAYEKMGSAAQELISTAIDRLKRSNGGGVSDWVDPEALCDADD